MNLLFIHQNFPGQFKHLAPALAARGHRVVALAIDGGTAPLTGVTVLRYRPTRSTSKAMHPWAMEFETKVIRGQACAQALLSLREQGFSPEVIIAHPGWGESLFAKDVFPRARLLSFIEFFYRFEASDVDFDPEFQDDSLDKRARLRLKNANNLLALDAMDHGITPTHWQHSTVPAAYRENISVIHDGIDTDHIRPNPTAKLSLPDGGTLAAGDEVLTFVARNLEPYRGYHRFLRALPQIQRSRPKAVTVIVGGNGVSYGAPAPAGQSWKDIFLAEVRDQLDLSRVVFAGTLPYAQYLSLMQISACHVYLTYPFVLSWSMLEAMSAGALVVGSRTAPVTEVIEHERNGLLVDFFDTDGLARTVADCLARPQHYTALREQARAHVVAQYDLKHRCLPAQLACVERLFGV